MLLIVADEGAETSCQRCAQRRHYLYGYTSCCFPSASSIFKRELAYPSVIDQAEICALFGDKVQGTLCGTAVRDVRQRVATPALWSCCDDTARAIMLRPPSGRNEHTSRANIGAPLRKFMNYTRATHNMLRKLVLCR